VINATNEKRLANNYALDNPLTINLTFKNILYYSDSITIELLLPNSSRRGETFRAEINEILEY